MRRQRRQSIDTGTAMASGGVHLSVSQGVPPFEMATSAGQSGAGLWLGRQLAPDEGKRQRSADRTREERAWHSGVRRDLPAGFFAENPDLLAHFPRITADANAMWADTANQATMLPAPRHHPELAARPAS